MKVRNGLIRFIVAIGCRAAASLFAGRKAVNTLDELSSIENWLWGVYFFLAPVGEEDE